MSISNFADELIKFMFIEHETKKYRKNTIITLGSSILYYLAYLNRLTSRENINIVLPCLGLITIWNFSKWFAFGRKYLKADTTCTKLAEDLIPECINDIIDVITILSEEEQMEFLNSLEAVQNSVDSVVFKLGALIPLMVSVHLFNIGITDFPCDSNSIKIAASKSFDRLAEKRDADSIEKIRSINKSLLTLGKLMPECYKIIQLEL